MKTVGDALFVSNKLESIAIFEQLRKSFCLWTEVIPNQCFYS